MFSDTSDISGQVTSQINAPPSQHALLHLLVLCHLHTHLRRQVGPTWVFHVSDRTTKLLKIAQRELQLVTVVCK